MADGDQIQQIEANEPKVRDSFMWIKDSKGFGSVTLTFITVAFWVTTLAYVLSMFEGSIPLLGFKLRPFDVGASTAYFGICAGMYSQRKWTEAKYASK